MNFVRTVSAVLILGSTLVPSFRAAAQPISVPNFSFESPTAPNTYPYVNTSIDDWQKNPEPDYWPAVESAYGIPWDGTAGVFLDVNPYANHDGSQVGYILSFPGVALYQDYSTTPSFNATYNVGRSYDLTVGVFGKPSVAPGSTLELNLYYRDSLNNMVTIGSSTITYDPNVFVIPTNGPLNLIDFTVSVPIVQASDAWAGQHIGIELLSTTPIAQSSGGNWDIDNVRLTETPEPSMAALLGLGAAGMWLRGKRRAARG